ncbi:adenine nucleotide alpha hydrolase family protein [Rubrivivax gelatinosus]|uniref:phosphoadenosine phosphosulfate reductase family protein n=1 Tax=Rubrivivax gelatinosus TaxID=28068 RepID=UPI0012FD2314|nr:phosphoadenosine phosphosulfate reductase family protein [Rubrivivax gelatinosus]MBG6083034.1 3'-phosphoadenosine 5'-phosphosulfate sulfotransferase (PAPS reductase)/FAD synthetase [Rubrivivax gelatinosus]
MGYEQQEFLFYEGEETDRDTSLGPDGEDAGGEAEQETVDPLSYDRVLVFFSGGKDSVACVLRLLDLGVPRDRIEVHHHLIDGREGSDLMDWPVTEAYCRAFANAFGLAYTISWKQGGMEREMLRDNQPTAPTLIPVDGEMVQIGGDGPLGTRRKFPQTSASLTTRWCSSYVKISVGAAYIVNHPKFLVGRTLVVTGERAEESSARAKYKRFEPHRSDNRNGARVKRFVDHWRPVHLYSEKDVWTLIEKYRVAAHPAYWLGWGRTSCMLCIFGSCHQWASANAIAPEKVRKVANYEREFKVTIHRKLSVDEQVARGVPYKMDPLHVARAMSTEYTESIIMDDWALPAGAYGESCGPT